MQLPNALAQFVVQLEADGRSPSTVGQYHRHISLLTRWASNQGLTADVSAIDHLLLAQFLCSPLANTRADGRPRKATSMNALRSSVKGFFGYLHRAGVLASDPSRLVRRAQCGPAPLKSLTVYESDSLLGVLAERGPWEAQRDRALFTLLLRTGLRLGSALALDIGDLDLVSGEIRFREGKWSRGGVAYLDKRTALELQRFVGERSTGALFTTAGGGRLSARQVQRRLAAWLTKAGITRAYTPHSLRHTFAQRLYDRTHDLLLVKQALGHRSLSAALVYAEAGEGDLRLAITGSR